MFLKGSCKKEKLCVTQYDERARYGNHDLGVFSEAFTGLPISGNPVKVIFKCFTRLNRLLCSSPCSGTLNFSLWMADARTTSIVGGQKIKRDQTHTVAELASLQLY